MVCIYVMYESIVTVLGDPSRSTHHVRIVWVDTHVRKRVESRKRTESEMAVELRKRIVWVLACLH